MDLRPRNVSYAEQTRSLKVGRPEEDDNNDFAEYKHDIRLVKIKVWVFGGCVAAEDVNTAIQEAKTRFEQSTIRVECEKIEMNVPVPASITKSGCAISDPPFTEPTEEEMEMYSIAYKDLTPNTIHIFYVSYFEGAAGTLGNSYPQRFNKTKLNSFKNFIVIKSGSPKNAMAHEMMHILLNDGHGGTRGEDPNTSLFCPKYESPHLERYKRIGPYTGDTIGRNDTVNMRKNSEKLP
jgi:hypothetical protein